MAEDILATICKEKQRQIARLKRTVGEQELLRCIGYVAPPRPFRHALQLRQAANQPALIAEIKKASPSRGVIREDFDVATIAKAYEAGGATCLSVLTDASWFQGSNLNLHQARNSCNLPVLRKDFILDPVQVLEARSIGADCILLIMAALTDNQALELEDTAYELGMAVLVETHDEAEVERALKLRSPLIGINNRNLKTLEVDLATTERLAPLLPSGTTVVCESGVQDNRDITRMRRCGVSCFLVGEALMAAEDIAAATRALLS